MGSAWPLVQTQFQVPEDEEAADHAPARRRSKAKGKAKSKAKAKSKSRAAPRSALCDVRAMLSRASSVDAATPVEIVDSETVEPTADTMPAEPTADTMPAERVEHEVSEAAEVQESGEAALETAAAQAPGKDKGMKGKAKANATGAVGKGSAIERAKQRRAAGAASTDSGSASAAGKGKSGAKSGKGKSGEATGVGKDAGENSTESATTAAGKQTAAKPDPRFSDSVNVVCCFCGSKCELSQVRIKSKSEGTWKCKHCCSAQTKIYRWNSGKLPDLSDKSQPEVNQFYLKAQSCSTQQDFQRILNCTEVRNVERSEQLYANMGQYLPLDVWKTQGFNPEMIKANTKPEDIRTCSVLGLCYRVEIMSTGNRGSKGTVSSDWKASESQEKSAEKDSQKLKRLAAELESTKKKVKLEEKNSQQYEKDMILAGSTMRKVKAETMDRNKFSPALLNKVDALEKQFNEIHESNKRDVKDFQFHPSRIAFIVSLSCHPTNSRKHTQRHTCAKP